MNDVFRYYAGTTTSKTILKDLAKVLATGVKTSEIINSHGEVIRDKQIIIDKNFDVVYPAPIKSSKELISNAISKVKSSSISLFKLSIINTPLLILYIIFTFSTIWITS